MATTITANGINFPDGSASAPSIGGTDTNTGLFTGSDIVGFATGGTERLRIDSSGRLLIGTTTVGSASADDLTVVTSGATGITVRSGTSNSGNLFFSDGTSGNDNFRGYVQYLHASNDLLFGTNATEKLRITSGGLVGIGEDAPQQKLHLHEASSNGNFMVFTNSTTGATGNDGVLFGINSDEGGTIWNQENTYIRFGTNDLERLRIDSSGRVLIGISSPRTYEQPMPYGGNDTVPALQLEGAGDSAGNHRIFAQTYNNNDVYAATHIFAKTRGGAVGGTTIVNSGDPLGILSFQGSDGSDMEEAASIRGEVDGTPGSNDMPGRLVFSTTADGANAPTEKLRINSSGDLLSTGRIAGGGAAFSDATSGHDDLVLKTSGSTGMTIVSGNTSNGTIAFADGTSGNAFYRSYFQYNHNNDLMSIGVGGGTMMEWTNANVKINDGDLVIGTSGHGINFSASASGNSPTGSILDDYEYGSFTPTIGGSSNNGSAAYSLQNGFYIKIGRLVTIYLDVTISSWSGASGVQRWTNLPFNKNELSGQSYYYEGVAAWYVVDAITNSKSNYQGYIADNTNNLNMYVGNTVETGSGAPVNVTGRCSITFTYSTSS